MIKKTIYGETLKEQLKASARDRFYHFLLSGGQVRGVILHGTRMINEMRANHELGVLETLVLGHGYLAAGLMSASLKGNDRISLQIDCSGPIRGLVVEANAFGEVRGHLKTATIPIEKPLESFDLSPFFGPGILSLTRHLEDAKQPFTGKIALMHGSIARDLTEYHMVSEQTPSAFNLSVHFDTQGEAIGAGGLFLQVMPGVSEETLAGLEDLVKGMPSIGVAFSQGEDPVAMVNNAFSAFDPQFLAERRVEFMCHCNTGKIERMLALLPLDELKDMAENGPFPLEIRCHHCNTPYGFSQEDLAATYRLRQQKKQGIQNAGHDRC